MKYRKNATFIVCFERKKITFFVVGNFYLDKIDLLR